MAMKVYWTLTKIMPHEQYASLLLTENVYLVLEKVATILFLNDVIV